MLHRKALAAAGAEADARRRAVESLGLALTAHEPRRVLERGYAMVDDGAGGVVTSAAQAREARDVRVTFADGSVDATIQDGTT